jgi:hypothetical protein
MYPYHFGNAVLKVIGQAKDDGVSGTGICRFVKNPFRLGIADLEDSPGVQLSAEIDAHRDHPMLAHVVVPRIVVTGTWQKTVHSPSEAADAGASRHLLN